MMTFLSAFNTPQNIRTAIRSMACVALTFGLISTISITGSAMASDTAAANDLQPKLEAVHTDTDLLDSPIAINLSLNLGLEESNEQLVQFIQADSIHPLPPVPRDNF